MGRTRQLAPLLAALGLLPGCGLFLANAIDPPQEFPPPPPRIETTTFVYTGEIRDHATFRAEEAARIEFWSDDPGYAPAVKLDGRGGFSVRVDTCREMSSPGADLVTAILLTGEASPTCLKHIGRFGVRARLGARCSLPIGDGAPSTELGGRLVLFLADCPDPQRDGRPWRPARVADGGP